MVLLMLGAEDATLLMEETRRRRDAMVDAVRTIEPRTTNRDETNHEERPEQKRRTKQQNYEKNETAKYPPDPRHDESEVRCGLEIHPPEPKQPSLERVPASLAEEVQCAAIRIVPTIVLR